MTAKSVLMRPQGLRPGASCACFFKHAFYMLNHYFHSPFIAVIVSVAAAVSKTLVNNNLRIITSHRGD